MNITAKRIIRHFALFLLRAAIGWFIYIFALAVSWTGPDGFSSPVSQAAYHFTSTVVVPWRWIGSPVPRSVAIACMLALPIYGCLVVVARFFRPR